MRFYGQSILRGLALTWRHLAVSYLANWRRRWRGEADGRRLVPDRQVEQAPSIRGIVTVQYPEERLRVPERFRFIPVLIYNADDPRDIRCTACGICAQVCPPQCIWIVGAKTPEGKPLTRPSAFAIDIDVCMNCGLCAEYCPFDAIKMDHHIEKSGPERERSHIYDLPTLLVSASSYAATHPRAYAQEEAHRRTRGKIP